MACFGAQGSGPAVKIFFRFYKQQLQYRSNSSGAAAAAPKTRSTQPRTKETHFVPALGHMDEVEEFGGHEIDNWTLYIIRLEALGEPDVFKS